MRANVSQISGVVESKAITCVIVKFSSMLRLFLKQNKSSKRDSKTSDMKTKRVYQQTTFSAAKHR